MQKISLILLVGISCYNGALAQNVLLQSYHPKNKEIVKLRTDSLHVRHEDGRFRRILYEYDDKGKLLSAEEIEQDAQSKLLSRSTQKFFYDGDNSIVETENKDAVGRLLLKQRCTQVVKANKQADSTLYWTWDGAAWQPTQKTKYIYDQKGNLVAITEYRMGQDAAFWVPVWSEWMEYDAQQRLSSRQYRTWQDTLGDWTTETEYRSEYKNGNVVATTRLNRQNDRLVNSERTETTYKGNSLKDSLIVYDWDLASERWQRRDVTVAASDGLGQLYETGSEFVRTPV